MSGVLIPTFFSFSVYYFFSLKFRTMCAISLYCSLEMFLFVFDECINLCAFMSFLKSEAPSHILGHWIDGSVKTLLDKMKLLVAENICHIEMLVWHD